jgi:hypothetical protein
MSKSFLINTLTLIRSLVHRESCLLPQLSSLLTVALIHERYSSNKGLSMDNANKLTYLRVALVAFGLFFIFGIAPFMYYIWPSGWSWSPSQHEYEQMIIGIYATLGVFLILASKDPLQNRSLIWFTVWSSVVHGAIMMLQALASPMEHMHLYGDVPALFLVAIILAVLMPKKAN